MIGFMQLISSASKGLAIGTSPVLVMLLIGWLRLKIVVARDRRLGRIAPRYNSTGIEITEWVPQYHNIQKGDAEQGKLFKLRSLSAHARRKSLTLIHEAQFDAENLYDQDPSEEMYVAVNELKRMCECCEKCNEVNDKQTRPICQVLDHYETKASDLARR